MAITASMDLPHTLQVLLEQVVAQLNVDAAAVLLCREESNCLEYASGVGFHTPAIRTAQLRVGEGHAGRAALERKTIQFVNGADASEPFTALLQNEGFVGYRAIPLIAKGQVRGVLEVYHRSHAQPDDEWMDFLEALARQAAIAVDNALLFEHLQRSHVELTLAYDATIEGWSHALELRDKETEGHTRRVTEMTVRLANALGMGAREMVHVRRGALLHDIGKMGIPDRILLKPGPLTETEGGVMRRHPVYAHDMLSPIAFLRQALEIPYCHHERWDGTGYPRGLRGAQIPLAARIFAVVDVWDALSNDRPYRAAWDEETVAQHIRSLSGTHFDPAVVEAFLCVLSTYHTQRPFSLPPLNLDG